MPHPRLLALTNSQEDGGAESHLRVTLAAAQARGYEVHVALTRTNGTLQLWDDLRRAGCAVHRLPIGRPTRSKVGAYAAMLRDGVAALWSIARVRPDAVLLNLPTPEATPGAMLACALLGRRTTAIFHLVRSDLWVTPRRRALYRAVARGSQQWVCVSEDNRATLAGQFGVAPTRIAVVRNGVSRRPASPGSRERVRAELGISADATLILTTGRLVEQKDHRVIVQALPRLVDELDRGLVFAWAGDGPLYAELAAAVHAGGLERYVRMLGRRDDVPELLAAADLFLMPSRDEGGAPTFALAEAMYQSVPAIVSDAGALTEVIDDRRNGLVFDSGDADDLVRVVVWALTHCDQLAQMAQNARQQALREFTLARMTEGLMAYVTAGTSSPA